MKLTSILKSVAGAAVVAAGTLTLAGPATAADTIKVGMSVSSTGNYALASQSGERGIGIWADDVNARGGIEVNGEKRKVELVKLDDRSDKQQVARVYETLIQDKGVDVVVAPFGSTLTGVAATVTERLNKFMVIWSAASESVYNQGFSRIVSATQMPVSVMPKASIDLAAKVGSKKIAIAYVDEPFPAGLAKAAKDLAEKEGIEVVLMEKFAKGTKDFSLLIQKAKAMGADAFYPSAYEGDQMTMVRQMKELDIVFPYVFMAYASTPQFQAMGKDMEYVYGHTNFHEAVNWKVTDGLDRAGFLKAYGRLYPKVNYEPDFQTALAYGAGVILEKIITNAGSLDADKLKQSALDLSGKITVMAGPYKIDEAGRQLGMPFVVTQKQGDELKAVFPDAAANAKYVYPIPAWSAR